MPPRSRPLTWLMLAVLPAALSACIRTPARTARAPLPQEPHIKVMTYNVNYALANDVDTRQAIANSGADVVFLQESSPAWEQALRPFTRSAYPHTQFLHTRGGAGGLAVLSRYPIESHAAIEPVSWFPAWKLVLRTPIGRVQVLNVHLRPPVSDGGSVVRGYFTTSGIREEEMRAFAASLDSGCPTLIVGDFNENERGRALEHLQSLGMKSALPEFQPSARTWRWNTSIGRLQARYDHIVYDARLEPLSVEVHNAGRSDHLPVVGTFVLAKDEVR